MVFGPIGAMAPTRAVKARRAARVAALLALLLAAEPPVLAQASAAGGDIHDLRLPALGESASDDFSLTAEKRLGEQIMREIRRDPDYLDDPPLLDYVQSIWQPLLAAARERGDIGPDTEHLFPYEPFLVRDRTVNAFALPGGYIGVNLGLIAMTDTPDELASVLGHELSHIVRRHIARSIAAASRTSTLGIVGLVLGMIAASRSNSPDIANAAIMGSQAAVAQSQLNFSRDMEREADRNGLALMRLAGFAPSGMADMFTKLDQANRLNDSGNYPWLRSHPLTTERIGEVRQRISLMAEPAHPTPVLHHLLMQARAKVLMDPNVTAWQRLQGFDQGVPPHTDAARMSGLYASALASMKLRDFARAGRALAAARSAFERVRGTTTPADVTEARAALDQLGVQIALAGGQVDQARTAVAAMPADGSRADLMLRAEVELADGRPEALRQCSESLQTWVAERKRDSRGWQLLSQCESGQGQTLRALRADAEAQAALDNLPGAIDRLRAGQQLARRSGASVDFIEASVIESRLRDLLAQQRRQMDESGKRRSNSDADQLR